MGRRRNMVWMFAVSMVCIMFLYQYQIFHSTLPNTPQRNYDSNSWNSENYRDDSFSYVRKAIRETEYSASGNCEPRFNLMYLKTHKCASSTMQNILFRYACTHNTRNQPVSCLVTPNPELNHEQQRDGITEQKWSSQVGLTGENPIIVAVPEEGVYAGCPERFSANMLKDPKWLLPPSGSVNMFGLHTRLNSYEMTKILHPGSLWITVLRNPIHLYPSLFSYFGIGSSLNVSLKEFLKWPMQRMTRTHRIKGCLGTNQMTFDLGYDQDVFYDDNKIDEMIADIEDTFNLILIAERMDESLILLGQALCWSVDDMVSFSKNVRRSKSNLTDAEQRKIEDLNYSDFRLYRHFASQFEVLTELYGKEKLDEEVKLLRAKRQEAHEYCIKNVVKGHHPNASIKEYSGKVLGFELSRPEDPLCKALAWNSRHYIGYFRERMKKLFSSSPPDGAS